MKATERNGIGVVVRSCGAAACLILAAQAPAQQGEAQRISSVEFVGLSPASQVLARDVAQVRPGDGFDRATLDSAVDRLLRTGRFLSAKYATIETGDGVRVTFTVRERQVLSAVRFEGNKKYGDPRLRKEVGLTTGEPIDHFAAGLGAEAIEQLYREAGYQHATATYDRQRLNETGELVYAIEEGARIRIREIIFEGRETFPENLLKRQIRTKTAFWFLRTGAFDEDAVEADVARVQNYYRDQGFLDAQVSHRVEAGKTAADLTLTFIINEGVRYAVEAIEFRGQQEFSAEELAEVMESKVGDTVKRWRVDRDIETIRNRYWEQGYIYAAIRAIRVFSDQPGYVRLTIQIGEGEQYRVGEITIRGNARTKDKVVRRQLNLYPPDDLLDLTEAKAAETRLVQTNVFRSARVLPVGNTPGVRDLIIDVQEAEKLGDFLFGFGITTNSGLVGNVVLDLRNFDLFDWPRSWGEFVRFRSFMGAGQRMRLELQPGMDMNRFRIDFTEPYLMDKPIRFDVSAFLFERGRDGYNERRGGARVSLGKRFDRGRLRGWSGELSLRAEGVKIDDSDLFAARDIHDDEGTHLMTSVKASLALDRTDSRFLPSVGDRFRVGYEQFGMLGGDHYFGKVTAKYQWYQTLRTDLLDRKSVLELRAQGGAIVGDAPIFERFYAGGTGSLRGFKFRGVGPHEGLEDNNVGGDYLALFGAEYSYPLYGDNLRGHVFFDTGAVGSGTIRASIGTGVRLTVNVFGPMPLEFNLAAPILSDSEDEEQMFSFLVGSLF